MAFFTLWPATSPRSELLSCFEPHARIGNLWVSSDALHVGPPSGGVLLEVDPGGALAVRTCLELHEEEVPTGTDHQVEERQVVGAHEPLALASLLDHLLIHRNGLVEELILLLMVCEARVGHTELLAQLLVELDNFGPHEGGLHRIVRDELQALVWTGDLQRIVGNDATLWDQLAGWDLEDWQDSSVEILVPLALVVQIQEHLLESHFLARECPPGPRDKRTQVMAVHADVAGVGRRLGFLATRPHKALQGVKLGLSMRLELLSGNHCHRKIDTFDFYL